MYDHNEPDLSQEQMMVRELTEYEINFLDFPTVVRYGEVIRYANGMTP
jgi:hypothetical protein